MKFVRIGVILGIVLSGIFVTLYGGTIPYRLFYFFLSIPLLCFVYTLYVYLRFKVYQTVEHKTLVKEEAAEYSVQVGNEDFITYENVKLLFFEDYSMIQDVIELGEYYLLPGEKKEQKTTVLCKYRGNYAVGVKSVMVTDFLHLFHITYPIRETCKVSVLPKIVELDSCFFLEENQDEKRVSTGFSLEQPERDIETRSFQSGDDIRMIHWKASAKSQELLVRKWASVTKQEVTIILETVLLETQDLITFGDKMLECTLAIAYYCVKQNTLCHVFYEQKNLKQKDIYDFESFEQFYEDTVTLYFNGKTPFYQMLEAYQRRENQIIVLLVATITQERLEAVENLVSENTRVIVLVMEEKTSDWEYHVTGAEFLFLSECTEVKRILEVGNAG